MTTNTEHGGDIEFTIVNEDNGREYRVQQGPGTPLHALIDKAYERMGISRQQGDRLRCEGSGEDVIQFASMHLRDYLASGHCAGRVWLFAGGTGGA